MVTQPASLFSATQMCAPATERERPPRRTFPRRLRVASRSDLRRAFANGVRVTDRRMTLVVLANAGTESRFGVSVGRRHGGAVRRVRIKRVLREAFRLSRCGLPRGLDIICVPRPGVQMRLDECRQSLRALSRQAGERLARSVRHAGRKRTDRQ